ncbi:MAG: RNA polymerase factor sigma-54 [Bacteroidota bacterium]
MLKQSLQQKLLQKLSPQQIQLMKLLQVPTMALDQRIKEELEINPALEEGSSDDSSEQDERDDDLAAADNSGDDQEVSGEERDDFDISEYISDDDGDYRTRVNNTGPDDERTEIPVVSGASFHDLLLSQLSLCDFDDKQYMLATHLIGSLDEDGYLRREVQSICDDLAFSQGIEATTQEVEEVLHQIQFFDPAGVGARDLRECLMLQIARKDPRKESIRHALAILDEYMEEFSKKHYEKIEKALELTDVQLKDAINEIIHLNPKPGGSFSGDSRGAQAVIPDFILTNNDGVFELTLNSRNAPDLRVSKQYSRMLEDYSRDTNNKSNREAINFIRQKLDAAKWFIDAIKQRQFTLIRTMQAILDYQREYFVEGNEKMLRPMILKDIAEIVQLDISTVSRVANSKYVQTPFGTFLLKTFFSEALSTDSGEEVSSREVKKILSDAIANEDKRKPLPDDKLMKILNEKGYNIARRTVAKYREQLGIPVARLRKEL